MSAKKFVERRKVNHGPFTNLRCKDLRRHSLTSSEKGWLGDQIRNRETSAPELSARYQLPLTQLYGYSEKSRKLKEQEGRPKSLDMVGRSELVDELLSLQRCSASEVKEHVYANVQQKICESNIRSGGSGIIRPVCDGTLRNIFKDLAISFVKPEIKTKARYNAENDIRNYFVEAAMDEAHMTACKASLVANLDATTFAVYGEGLESTVGIVRGTTTAERSTVAVLPGVNNTGLGIYVKVYNMISMGLSAAPPVIILADETLQQDSFFSFKVNGLSHDLGTSSYGYIVLCQSRAGNDQFYQWYYRSVVVRKVKSYTCSLKTHDFLCCRSNISKT